MGRHRTTPPPLSAREIRFCREYAEHGNATRSYIDAGFPHASTNAAGVGAFALLRKPKIRAYIRTLQSQAAEVAQISLNLVAHGLYRDGWADRSLLFGPDGEMLPPGQWPREVKDVITGVEVEELTEHRDDPDRPGKKKKVAIGYRWKVKTSNRTEARKLLGTWLGMFEEKKPTEGGAGKSIIEIPANGRDG